MGLTSIRAPQKDDVDFLDLPVGDRPSSCSEDRRQTDDAGSVSGSIAGVDIVRPHHRPGEFLRQVVDLVGGFRAREHAEGVGLSAVGDRSTGSPESCGCPVQRFVPGGLSQPAIGPTNKWSRQARSVRWFPHTIGKLVGYPESCEVYGRISTEGRRCTNHRVTLMLVEPVAASESGSPELTGGRDRAKQPIGNEGSG